MGSLIPKNEYAFPLAPNDYAPAPVPSLSECQHLWKVWDLVTTKMIPPDALMEQPIPLRNPLLFYMGHIPTSEGIHLARATDSAPTEPAYYHAIFERGIDPDIDDPSICHDHSELPDVFPPLEEILMHRERVELRIRSLYETGKAYVDRRTGRALWIGFEHEEEAARHRVKNEWFRIPQQTFTIGFHDPETDTGPDRFFAWDNERAPYDTQVHCFETHGRPVSNGEYADYLITTKQSEIPATWSRTANSRCLGDEDYGGFISSHGVKTVWGLVPLSQALDWPVMAGICTVGWCPSANFEVFMNMSSNGLRSSQQQSQQDTDPRALFADLVGTNSGFQNFHPVSITHMKAVCGLGNTGGAAEWTSDLFQPQPHSADFMDGKHIATLGGSWALHPRLAGYLSWC
ncbi:hypothetical protein EDB80DRAFT_752821 [Ilyonectria destructans]|nr:hypothetical protein EDB80DRAFT_752821 [Ilyonectria destructans]